MRGDSSTSTCGSPGAATAGTSFVSVALCGLPLPLAHGGSERIACIKAFHEQSLESHLRCRRTREPSTCSAQHDHTQPGTIHIVMETLLPRRPSRLWKRADFSARRDLKANFFELLVRPYLNPRAGDGMTSAQAPPNRDIAVPFPSCLPWSMEGMRGHATETAAGMDSGPVGLIWLRGDLRRRVT